MPLRSIVFLGLVGLAAVGGVWLAVRTLPDPAAPATKRLESRVRAYLLANPEVIFEAARAYQQRQANVTAARRRQALARQGKALRVSSVLPVAGNPRGDVTIVEFFDYRCGFCKRSFGPLQALLAADGNIRFVFKELPLLGPESDFAARAAIASARQGKYVAFHGAMMRHRGRFDPDTVFAIAGNLGLDVDRLRADMAEPRVGTLISEIRRQAEMLGVSGTPAFVIGDAVVPGYVGLHEMQRLVAAARERCLTC